MKQLLLYRSEHRAMRWRINGEGSISPTLDATGNDSAKVTRRARSRTAKLATSGQKKRARQESNLRPSA